MPVKCSSTLKRVTIELEKIQRRMKRNMREGCEEN